MKTPKVDTPKPKHKFNTPKGGLVRKSLGQTPAKNLKKLTAKGADHVLSMVKDNEENVEFKSKGRMSLPANALNNRSPANGSSHKTPKQSPKATDEKSQSILKSGKKQSIIANKKLEKENMGTPLAESKQNNSKTPVHKNIPHEPKTPTSVENNSSPIKKNTEGKKSKVPFNLNDSLLNKTPNEPKQKKGNPTKSKAVSPEVELGLRLEEALSPKSKKDKLKKTAITAKLNAKGKTEVNKKTEKTNKIQGTKNELKSTDVKPRDNAKLDKKKKNRSRKNKISTDLPKGERKPSMLKAINVKNSVNALLKVTEGKKNDLLGSDQSIFLQFNLVKLAKDSKGAQKILLPHSILPDNPEVCLIVPDLKGHRNEPEEAIDHFKERLKQNNISSITEIIPFRKLKQEYSQIEETRKLADRIDCFISEASIMRVGRIGRKFARSKKVVCPINLRTNNLKEEVDKALRRVPIFCSGKGTSFTVKCGRRGMPADKITDNIVTIGEFLANNTALVGDPSNLNTIVLKTEKSTAFPIFVSTVTPNDVPKPKGKQKSIEKPVEDEVTTVEDATVVVYPSGNVKVNKRKNNQGNDESVAQEKPSKKAKTNSAVKLGEVEFDSDESDDKSYDASGDDDDEDSSVGSEEEAGSEVSIVEEEDEGEDGSVVEEDDDEDDLESEAEEEDEDTDEDHLSEEEIELAEKEYLQELRQLQDETGKPKGKKSAGKAQKVEKQTALQAKKQEVPKGKVEQKKQKKIAQQVEKETIKEKGGKIRANQKLSDSKQNITKGNQSQPQKNKTGLTEIQQNKAKQNGQKKGNTATPNKAQQPFGQGKGRENSSQNKGKTFGQGKGPKNEPKGSPGPKGKGNKQNFNKSPKNIGKSFGQGKRPNHKGSPSPSGGNNQKFNKKGLAGKNRN